MALSETDEITIRDIGRLHLGPSDILVFKIDVQTTNQFNAATEGLKPVAERMGIGDRFLCISSDVDLAVIANDRGLDPPSAESLANDYVLNYWYLRALEAEAQLKALQAD